MWRLFGLISLIKGLRLNSQDRKSVLVNAWCTANNAHENEWNLGFVRLMNWPLPFIKFIMFKGWGVLEGVTFHNAPSCWFTCFFLNYKELGYCSTVKISFYNRFPFLPPFPPSRCVIFTALMVICRLGALVYWLYCVLELVWSEDSDRVSSVSYLCLFRILWVNQWTQLFPLVFCRQIYTKCLCCWLELRLTRCIITSVCFLTG